MRVGIVSRTATYWPLYLMAHAGVVELVELGSTSAGVDALLGGRVDVAATCPDVLLANGAPLDIAAGLVDAPPTTIVARSGIVSVAGLRGRRVATTAERGSVSLFLRAALRARGLAPGEYAHVVCGPTPAQAEALARGVVDAAMLTWPFDADLVARGFVALVDVAATLGPCAFCTLNVRPGFTLLPAWAAFERDLRVAIARLADRRERPAALAALARATGVRSDAVPAALRFALDLPTAGLERLRSYLRDEGGASAGGAS